MTTLTRILLVEDDPDIRAVATYAMESIGGYHVKACADGREALEALDGFDPELVLLDVMMPDIDGPSLLPMLRARSGVPVVFLTARTDPDEVEGYKSMGVLDVIAKPFDPLSLPASIAAIWNRVSG